MISKHNVLHGSCLCEKIQFTVCEDSIVDIVNCHCRMCSKASGSFSICWACIDRKSIFYNEVPYLTTYFSSKNVKRSFCNYCGSNVFWQSIFTKNIIWFSVVLLDTSLKQPVRDIFKFESMY